MAKCVERPGRADLEWLRGECPQPLRDGARRFGFTHVRSPGYWGNQSAGVIVEQSFFPDIRSEALIAAIGCYQRLGCRAGDVSINRSHYETALDVVAHYRLVNKRHPYDKVVVPPPV